MADQFSDEKTERPSPQKLRKAREEGLVVRSRDLATAIGILATLKLVVLLMPGWLEDFRRLFAQSYPTAAGDGALDNAWSQAFATSMALLAKMTLPMLLVPLAVMLGALVPGGWVFSASHLRPKLERLNPLANLARMWSAKHAASVASAVAKAAALGFVLVHASREAAAGYLRLQGRTLDRALVDGAGLVLDGVMAMVTVFVVFALIDVPLQRHFFLREQRMSRRELKEEHKTSEGRPEVRQRIRRLQQQLARRGVRKSVPTADVVVVNPEHYAVALKYDEKRAEAPFVVAKGVDEMALYIRHVAAEHGVEVLELPPLARAIYNTSQVHQQIPVALYKAVAQVLTYVLQLKAFQTGRRGSRPPPPSDLAVPAHMTKTSTP